MRITQPAAVLAVVFLLLSGDPPNIAAADEDGFHAMLNGRDLTGWVLVNTPPQTWSFEDGVLVCTGKPIGEMRTEKMYQNFVMEVEWRHMVPKGNAGIFVWADDITARGQPFHRGVEVQVLENAYGQSRGHTTHGDIFPIHGAKMTPVNGRGGSRAFPTENRSKPSPEWNHYRIECIDGSISLAVNGAVVTRGTDCSPRKGYICIESEGGIVQYRNMRIKPLPDTPVKAEHVASANRDFRSLYSGLDLSGWMPSETGQKSWAARDWVLAFDGNVSGKAAALVSEEQFEELQFVIDVKLPDEKSSATIGLRNKSGADFAEINLMDAAIAGVLEPKGRWNRVEGVVVNNSLKLTVNGRQLFDKKPVTSRSGPASLVIVPVGKVEFANIFVRRP